MGEKSNPQLWINIIFSIIILFLLSANFNIFGSFVDTHTTFGHDWKDNGPYDVMKVDTASGKVSIGNSNQGDSRFYVNGDVSIGNPNAYPGAMLTVQGKIRHEVPNYNFNYGVGTTDVTENVQPGLYFIDVWGHIIPGGGNGWFLNTFVTIQTDNGQIKRVTRVPNYPDGSSSWSMSGVYEVTESGNIKLSAFADDIEYGKFDNWPSYIDGATMYMISK